MAIKNSDWTVTRLNGNIRYIGDDHDGISPSYATVIEFHRWLQSLADNATSTGDDELDITNTDPSRRSTDNIITLINGYNITNTEAEHLFDGSIIQDDGDTIYDGIVNFGNISIQLQIIQNGEVLSDDWWNYNGGGLNSDSTAGISHRFMIKVRDLGSDIDGRVLIGTTRRYGYTYSEFSINGTSRGNNVLALSDSLDLNNTTAIEIVSGWTSITNIEAYSAIDVNNDNVDEYYYSKWNKDTYTINQFYERMKYLTSDSTTETLYGLNGELFRGITHQISITDLNSGDWDIPELITWDTGTGQLISIDNETSGSATILWMQLLTGTIPNNTTILGSTNSATATSGVIVERIISKPFCGVSTGSAIIGSYGFGIQVANLTSSDKVTDLSANVVTPPNYVTNVVAGLISGEDRVLVAPWDGVSYDINNDPAITKDQLTLSSSLTTDNITTIIVIEDIPLDTPSIGYIRVADDDGFERRLHYTSWQLKTFIIDTIDGNEDFDVVNATSGNNIYIAYIDTIASSTTSSFTSVQLGIRQLVVIVRDGGVTPIKQFISEWTQTSSASTITAIRTTDI